MKKIKSGLFLFALSFGLFSCIKEETKIFTGAFVEFDAAVLNTNTAYMRPPDSIAFPMLVRRPAFGRAVNTTDQALGRTSDTVTLRVNLVAAPRKQATIVNYRVVDKSEYAIIGVANDTTNLQAVAGVHFAALQGSTTIPADSSFGYIRVKVLNTGTASPKPRELVLMLTESADIKPSRNYKVVGMRISQL
jgi:hypothetical protein